MPKISVIIPTFNSAHYICEAIESVLQQTYKDIEIVVVDDGSTDNTKEVLNKYIDNNSINYLYQANQGPGAARNMGVSSATGSHIAFLDSDDTLTPDSLEKRINLMISCPDIKVVFSDFFSQSDPLHYTVALMDLQVLRRCTTTHQSHGIVINAESFQDIFELAFYIWTGTVLVAKTVLDGVGPFKSDIFGHEDTDMWLRILKKHKVGYINAPLAYYKQFRSNLTVNIPLKYARDRLCFLNPLLKEHSSNAIISRIIRKRIAWVYYDLASYYQVRHLRTKSMLNYAKSIHNSPWNMYVYQSMLMLFIPNIIKKLFRNS